MVVKNQIYESKIDGFTSEGLGVCHIEGCAVFVPNCVKDEICKIRIEAIGKHNAFGKIVEIVERSPHRVNRKCPFAKQCGGCAFWHMDYEAELDLKRQRVYDCLSRLGGVDFPNITILGADTQEGYRNKAQYPVGVQKGKPVAGFYMQKSHEIVPVAPCLIQSTEADTVKQTVMDWVTKYKVPCYDEKTHTGLLRHIYVRVGKVTGEVLVCLVVNGEKLPAEGVLVERLKNAVPKLKTVVLNVNTRQGNAVLGEKLRPLFGDGTIEDELCGLRFRLSAKSFYQVNHDQAERLYALALEQAGLTGKETVLDLYCGTGTITLCLAKQAGRAIGVEVVEAAIADAKENAKRNGIENAEFFCADAGQAAAKFAAEGIRPDVIVIDPPRKGVSIDVIEAMVQMAPSRIVYVSCDPATLARDVKLLTERGYEAKFAQAVDMFPRCSHVETVVLLSKLSSAPHIEVDLAINELDITRAESKATYDEIKAYVAEHYDGMKVSSLNIAQVKRKLGIIERENYNPPKSDESKQPNCTLKKEKAIMESFRYFRMI